MIKLKLEAPKNMYYKSESIASSGCSESVTASKQFPFLPHILKKSVFIIKGVSVGQADRYQTALSNICCIFQVYQSETKIFLTFLHTTDDRAAD